MHDTVDDYFNFRESFLSVAVELKLDSWSLEQMLNWYNKQSSLEPVRPTPVEQSPPDEEEEGEPPVGRISFTLRYNGSSPQSARNWVAKSGSLLMTIRRTGMGRSLAT